MSAPGTVRGEDLGIRKDADANRVPFSSGPKVWWMRKTPKAKTDSSDAELLRRFSSGDDRAFNELYARHSPKLFRYTFGMIGDKLLAEDIVQVSWERIIERRQCAHEIRILPALLFNIARNLTLDQFRRSSQIVRLDELATTEHPLELHHERTSEEELVLMALESLPWETKEMLVLHYESGYSFEEIAAMFDKRPSAIWTRVSRARTTLKKIVERGMRDEKVAEESR